MAEMWIAPGDACFLGTISLSVIGDKVNATDVCSDQEFSQDYSIESHVLTCVTLNDYDILRLTGHCYEPDLTNNTLYNETAYTPRSTVSLRITDERLRSVCVIPFPVIIFGVAHLYQASIIYGVACGQQNRCDPIEVFF